jgi:PHP family Zn ribbon phosphoesterase
MAFRTYVAELHVHSVLSPCAEIEMIPPLIVREALQRGIDLIAVTDHNASANVGAVVEAARGTGLSVLAGIELETCEAVHVVCLFDELEQLEAWQSVVDSRSPDLDNDIEYYGEQFVVDATGDFVRREPRLLLASTEISVREAIEGVTELGGIAIPAHVDAPKYSLLEALGGVPPDLGVEALEISRNLDPALAVERHPQLRGYPLLQNGEVHRLSEFLGANRLELAAPTIAELRLALRGEEGRSLALRRFGVPQITER